MLHDQGRVSPAVEEVRDDPFEPAAVGALVVGEHHDLDGGGLGTDAMTALKEREPFRVGGRRCDHLEILLGEFRLDEAPRRSDRTLDPRQGDRGGDDPREDQHELREQRITDRPHTPFEEEPEHQVRGLCDRTPWTEGPQDDHQSE